MRRIPTIPTGLNVEDLMRKGKLCIEREDGDGLHIGPSTIDLHLHPEIGRVEGGGRVGKTDIVNIEDSRTYPDIQYNECDEKITVQPNEFLLATTDEIIELDGSLMGIIHGRSSIGRLGLFVENAGLVDRGFNGQLTLELFNATSNIIEIPVYQRVAQMLFLHHEDSLGDGYDGKYQEQMSVTASRGFQDEQIISSENK